MMTLRAFANALYHAKSRKVVLNSLSTFVKIKPLRQANQNLQLAYLTLLLNVAIALTYSVNDAASALSIL